MISKHALKLTIHFGCAFVLGTSILTSTGCLGGLGLTGATLPTDPVSTEASNHYQVEMMGAFTKSAPFEGEIDGPLTVQDALERSGAIKKFRSMDIMIYRVVEETGRVLKMKVEYTPRTKTVKPELNYAIHPNDRIMVQARSLSSIDKFVDSLSPNN